MSDQNAAAAVINRFLDAIEQADLAALTDCYAPAARIWHNTDKLTLTVEENAVNVKGFFEGFTKRRYGVRKLQPLPKGALLQFTVSLETAHGKSFDMAGCIVIEIDNGKIALLEEYVDVASLMAAIG